MKKFLALCLASLMTLGAASAVLADDIMLIAAAPETDAEEIVIHANAPKTAPFYGFDRMVEVEIPAKGEVDVPVFRSTDTPVINEGTAAPATALVRKLALIPATVQINLDVTEGGSVNAPAKFYAAVGSTRILKIDPAEGYKIADIVVNGISYGPAYKAILKPIEVALDIQVIFEENLVEVFTPVYTENFDGETKWVKGGHMDAIAVADGVLTATSTGGDPNINYPEAFGLNCDDIDAIRIKFTNNTENTAFQIFFTNEANPGYSEAGSFRAESVIGENELVIYTAGNELWTGTLSNMRIDLSNGAGSYIVDSISFDTVTMEAAK